MSDSADDLLALAAHLYDAAANPVLWEAALQRICQTFNGLGIEVVVLDVDSRRVALRRAYYSPAEQLSSDSRQNLAAHALGETPLGEAGSLRPHEIQRSDYTVRHTFKSWLDENCEHGLCLAATVWLWADEVVPAVTSGASATDSAAARVLRLWGALEPHVRRALRLGERWRQLEKKALGAAAMDLLSCGLLLLDVQGNVTYINQRAEEHLARGDGLVVSGDGALETRRTMDRQRLRAVLAQALGPSRVDASMVLPRPDSPYPYMLRVVPFSLNSSHFDYGHAAAALLVTEPDFRGAISDSALQQLFGLTAREAELVIRLSQGEPLKASAEQLGITVKTARHHLEAVFRKTGTARQAELIALVNAFALRPALVH